MTIYCAENCFYLLKVYVVRTLLLNRSGFPETSCKEDFGLQLHALTHKSWEVVSFRGGFLPVQKHQKTLNGLDVIITLILILEFTANVS